MKGKKERQNFHSSIKCDCSVDFKETSVCYFMSTWIIRLIDIWVLVVDFNPRSFFLSFLVSISLSLFFFFSFSGCVFKGELLYPFFSLLFFLSLFCPFRWTCLVHFCSCFLVN